MRVVHGRIGVHQRLEHVISAHLADALEHALVALAQGLGGVGPRLAREHQRQHVALDALAPELVEFGLVARPRRLAAVEGEALVGLPVGLLPEQRERVLHALAVALLQAGEQREGRLELARVDHLVELPAQRLEGRDVCGHEVAVLAIERVQIVLEHLRGEFLVDLAVAVVPLLEDGGDARRQQRLPAGRAHGALGQREACGERGRARGLARRRRRQHEQAGGQERGNGQRVA